MIVWISSYPKSGNTWVRALLSSYIYSENGSFDFHYLNKINQFPKEDYFTQFSKNFDSIKEVSKYWIAAQNDINKKNKTIFFKTHSANCIIDDNPFTNKENTLGIIYIVRDPRNIITSLANHYEISLDEAYNFFTNERKYIVQKRLKPTMANAQVIGSWRHHYLSWKHINFAPMKIIKYEDLNNNAYDTFISILKFLNQFMKIKIDENKIKNTLQSCNFEVLKRKEKEEGFFESPLSKVKNKKISFFHLGKKNNWKNTLDNNLEEKIRIVFSKEMKELGYL